MAYLEFSFVVEEVYRMNQEKLEAKKYWNRFPCGAGKHLSRFKPESLEWFDEVRRSRYEDTDRWMTQKIDFSAAKNKKLLEIGFGIGSDLLTFCENGAEVYGIDLSDEHYRLASKNFELHNQKCTLKICDASEIGFPTNYFDVVYSNGVLHHTPDTARCISEAYRVLKPGGLFILSMYYKYSAFHLYNKCFYDGILRGKLRLGYNGLMSTVERGADGLTLKPLVKTYSKRKLRNIMHDFSSIKLELAHFTRDHLPGIGIILPRNIEQLLEPLVGWYLIAFAKK